jgi:hypothetical protein
VCTLLFASLLLPDLRVPADYIAATVSLQQYEGYSRQELKSDEKKTDSKVWFLTGTIPSKSPVRQAEQVIPKLILDFQVAISSFFHIHPQAKTYCSPARPWQSSKAKLSLMGKVSASQLSRAFFKSTSA